MALSILVRLTGGRYDAGGERPSDSEWPPHPARMFCALAASAVTEADWSALRWLERQEVPQVWADPLGSVSRSRNRAYVVQNATKNGGGNLTHPGRTNGLRTRAFAVPSGDVFAVVWPGADPPPDVLSQLGSLAWRVPYVGRSTGTAQVSAIGALPDAIAGNVVYEPAELGSRGRFRDLRVPYAGYADALRDAYADGRRAWEVARSRPYTTAAGGKEVQSTSGSVRTVAGPFSDLLVWGIERPVVRVGGDLAVSLAGSLRRAVLSRVPDPVPGQVSGHTERGRLHVAFLALPDVGHEHADGHLLGLALAIPHDMPEQDLEVLTRALIGDDELTEVRSAMGRPVAVSYRPDRAGLRAARWTAGRGESEWVTVTPVMLDGHTRRKRDEACEVARSLTIAGYPEPADVEVSASPLVSGGIWRPRPGTLPAGRPRRQMVHARIRFPQPVIGPVLAGSMRYVGLGLFQPVAPPAQPRADRAPSAEQDLLASGRSAVRDLAGVRGR